MKIWIHSSSHGRVCLLDDSPHDSATGISSAMQGVFERNSSLATVSCAFQHNTLKCKQLRRHLANTFFEKFSFENTDRRRESYRLQFVQSARSYKLLVSLLLQPHWRASNPQSEVALLRWASFKIVSFNGWSSAGKINPDSEALRNQWGTRMTSSALETRNKAILVHLIIYILAYTAIIARSFDFWASRLVNLLTLEPVSFSLT